MSKMLIVDKDGFIVTDAGTLKPTESEHPVWKARNAVALDKGGWLYAPEKGHELKIYSQKKQTLDKAEEFQKAAVLYLQPYGPDVVSRLIKRGEASFNINITRETVNG